MSAPKHLWSGDWQKESSAVDEQVIERRGSTDAPAEPPPAQPPRARPAAPRPRPLHEALARIVASVRGARLPHVQGAVLVGIATLLSAVIAYAAVSALVSPNSESTTQNPHHSQRIPSSGARAGWLGVETTSFPLANGAMITNVAQGGPADVAGLEPGDIITAIDNRTVQSPADVVAALAGLHAGQQVQIGYERGAISLTTAATLTTRPGSP